MLMTPTEFLASGLAGGEASLQGRVDMMLKRARWAAQAFAGFDRERTLAVARAVAEAGAARARHYGEWAVRETGFGVAEHKALKNELTSTGFYEHYREHDFVGPRIRAEEKIVEIPSPAGVVLALTPSTNPICTVYFKILCALLTRNAIIVSPHPAARECAFDATEHLAAAARAAGAPEGVIQGIREPTMPLIELLLRSDSVNVILATGGSPMVRAAYSSGNPAIGVGPGNAPAFVDSSADAAKAAQRIIDSKSFDNSVLCTNESVVLAEDGVARELLRHMQRAGAHMCSPTERDALRGYLFKDGRFNVAALGKSAGWIAQQAGIRVPGSTRVLLAEIERVAAEEPLSREKLCPVLGFVRVANRAQGIAMSRALLRMSGAGHSASIHSRDPRTIMEFGVRVNALRVVVNSPCSQGAAGYATKLSPSFTIGTGYAGRSSVGENVGPQHLVHWTRIAWNAAADEPFGDFTGIDPWSRQAVAHEPEPTREPGGGSAAAEGEVREAIRRIVLEELRQMLGK